MAAPQPTKPTTTSSEPFADVFERSGPKLYRQALAIVGERSAAEDVVQEAFARVWRRRGALREPGRLSGYLSRAVRNLAVDHVRRRKTAGKAIAATGAALVTQGKRGDGPDVEKINKALFRLSAEQREVVMLRVYEGMPFKEIAAQTEVPLGTVHSRYRYAMERLRVILGGKL